MACYRIDVVTTDAEADAFCKWVHDHAPSEVLIRSVGFRIPDGWFFKNVFSDQEAAEQFHRHWFPDADDHSVSAY